MSELKINNTTYSPIDIIGESYMLMDKDRAKEQLSYAIDTGLCNCFNKDMSNTLKFIYTDKIDSLLELCNEYINKVSNINSKSIILDEVFYSTRLSGADTSLLRASQIQDNREVDDTEFDEKMVRNLFNAIDKSYNITEITEDSIYKLWCHITNDACDRIFIHSTFYRNGNVRIGKFIPPTYKVVPTLMNKFVEFYNSSLLEDYPLLKAILVYYLFETIHPFCDGNGRIGRLLMNKYLQSKGIDFYKINSISKVMYEDYGKYSIFFIKSENKYNDCTAFIELMLKMISIALLSNLEL